MRIIHCSDLHLDADLRTKYDAASAAERRAELLDSFRRLCRYAREEDVSAVLICGDLFDTTAPSPSAVRTVEDLILGNSGILFFYLRGNHDEKPVLFRTRPKPDNLCLFKDDWTSWELSHGEEQGRSVCITGKEPSAADFTAPDLDPACLNIDDASRTGAGGIRGSGSGVCSPERPKRPRH
jgi:DNA repair exonuclease SbcCD nuclease subunit